MINQRTLAMGLICLSLLSIFSLPVAAQEQIMSKQAESSLALSVTDVVAEDIANWGNGADMAISFVGVDSESDIEYRIIVAHADKILDPDIALNLPSDVYTLLPPKNITDGLAKLVLTAESVDSDGELISEDLAYQIYILSLADGDVELTMTEQAIILRNETIVRTLIEEFPAATGGVAVDADGNIFVGDIGRSPARQGTTVYKIAPDGEYEVFAEADTLLGASGNAFDDEGNLYQSGLRAGQVNKITPDGEVTIFNASSINAPVGIVVADDGSLYVANCGSGTIVHVELDGTTKRLVFDGLLQCPNGIALDNDGNIYVANFRNGDVLKVTPDGDEVIKFATVSGNNNGHITFDGEKFYVVARASHQIYTLTLDGELELFAGSGERGNQNGLALEATFSLPNDLSISPDGRILYLNEFFSVNELANQPSRIRMIMLARDE